jgi:hypothetical protein
LPFKKQVDEDIDALLLPDLIDAPLPIETRQCNRQRVITKAVDVDLNGTTRTGIGQLHWIPQQGLELAIDAIEMPIL